MKYSIVSKFISKEVIVRECFRDTLVRLGLEKRYELTFSVPGPKR